MLYMIGLGLADEKDISVKGQEAVDNSDRVFLESYTSLLQTSREDLAKHYGKPIEILGRAGVEQQAEEILDAAEQGDAAFLVVGDVFTATTHSDLFLRAKERGIEVKVIPNAGIINGIGLTGLDLYKFGRTTTFVYPEGNYAPESFYDVIMENRSRGLHTLCLLDIKAEEGRFMTVPEAIDIVLSIANKRGDDLNEKTLALGAARIASETQTIVAGPLSKLKDIDWGGPPHSLVIPGKLHHIEEEMLSLWK